MKEFFEIIKGICALAFVSYVLIFGFSGLWDVIVEFAIVLGKLL